MLPNHDQVSLFVLRNVPQTVLGRSTKLNLFHPETGINSFFFPANHLCLKVLLYILGAQVVGQVVFP
jgi:hypothetical protein